MAGGSRLGPSWLPLAALGPTCSARPFSRVGREQGRGDGVKKSVPFPLQPFPLTSLSQISPAAVGPATLAAEWVLHLCRLPSATRIRSLNPPPPGENQTQRN